MELRELGEFESQKQAQKNVVQAIKNTAKHLGNRPATCRKYYVHPAIIEAYNNRVLLNILSQRSDTKSTVNQLNPEETAILEIIKKALPL